MSENKNRIAEEIRAIEDKVKILSQEKLARLPTLVTIENDGDLFSMQDVQARAFASGRINELEAHTLYTILGGEFPTAARFNARTFSERFVTIASIAELCHASLA